MRQGIADWIRRAIPQGSLWGWFDENHRPEMPIPFTQIRFMMPPRPVFHAGEKTKLDAVRINTAADQVYTINLVSGPIAYDASAVDTVTTIRDALIALIAGSFAFGADTLVLPSNEHLQDLVPVSPEPNIVPKILMRQDSLGRATLQVDVYAIDSEDALDRASSLQASLSMFTHRETLNHAGWGIAGIEGPQSIPETVNASRRGRASFDVILSCRYEIDEILDYVVSSTVNPSTDVIGSGSFEGSISG